MSSTMNITDLPDECLSNILSLTSPKDVIRSSAVSKQFSSVSESDAVWINFLPSNLDEIVSQSPTPLLLQQFNSKKDLYFHLCSNPVLFNAQTQSFELNKWNGKKWYMLGARALQIIWGNTPQYWNWKHVPESRFPETAKLLNVCWLLIEATVNRTILSTSTTYGAYFVYKMADNDNTGFESTQVKSFALNKWNGKKCYMLGARALKVIWGDTPFYWTWEHLPESRFPETAKLLNVCWLLIEANVHPTILSPNTTYGAYIVHKMDAERNHGFEHVQIKTFMFEVPEGDESSGLPPPPPHDEPFKHFYLKAARGRRSLTRPRNDLPVARDDGWMEIEMGRYFVGDSIDESVMLRMTLLEIDNGNWKSGLIVQGIELRPLD